MQASLKWLLVPPALALVLFLGPLRDFGSGNSQGSSSDSGSEPTRTELADAKRDNKTALPREGTAKDSKTSRGTDSDKSRTTAPSLPSLPQATSALIGVLLLGGTFVFLLAKLRQSKAPSKGIHIAVRQSVRLSQRQQLHAISWDDKLLLVGECDGKLAVLREANDPQIALDEQSVARRGTLAEDPEDEGAVPRDMIIPRAPGKPARLGAPKAPVSPAAAAATKALAEFKTLLSRAQKEQTVS